jgi:hypothetical protein
MPLDHHPDLVRVADHQRQDREGPGNGLEAERGQPVTELPRSRAQAGEPLAPVVTVGDVDRLDRGRAVGRAERVRVDVGVRL